ncbi:MAG: hypothetical protein ACRER2_11100, partial [Methylococcales bacterium]
MKRFSIRSRAAMLYRKADRESKFPAIKIVDRGLVQQSIQEIRHGMNGWHGDFVWAPVVSILKDRSSGAQRQRSSRGRYGLSNRFLGIVTILCWQQIDLSGFIANKLSAFGSKRTPLSSCFMLLKQLVVVIKKP